MNALELLSLLQAKLGKSAVLKPDIACDPRPEKASQYRLADEPDVPTHSIPDLLRPAMQLPAPLLYKSKYRWCMDQNESYPDGGMATKLCAITTLLIPSKVAGYGYFAININIGFFMAIFVESL